MDSWRLLSAVVLLLHFRHTAVEPVEAEADPGGIDDFVVSCIFTVDEVFFLHEIVSA